MNNFSDGKVVEPSTFPSEKLFFKTGTALDELNNLSRRYQQFLRKEGNYSYQHNKFIDAETGEIKAFAGGRIPRYKEHVRE